MNNLKVATLIAVGVAVLGASTTTQAQYRLQIPMETFSGDGGSATDSGSASGPQQEPASGECLDPANVGTVGQWEGCQDMLIVDRSMLDTASLINGGKNRAIQHNGNDYTFGFSFRNIFTGQVKDFSGLFQFSTFDGAIGYWDTSSAETMEAMFKGASSFNQNLSGWCVDAFSTMPGGFSDGVSGWQRLKPQWGDCPAVRQSDPSIQGNVAIIDDWKWKFRSDASAGVDCDNPSECSANGFDPLTSAPGWFKPAGSEFAYAWDCPDGTQEAWVRSSTKSKNCVHDWAELPPVP